MPSLHRTQPTSNDPAPWLDTRVPEWSGARATTRFDVTIAEVVLTSHPAQLAYSASVDTLSFTSTITYESIPDWDFLDDGVRTRLIAAILAWDSMRFLALGGTRVVLPDNYRVLDSEAVEVWRDCFMQQFGEWRFRNEIFYESPELPDLIAIGANDTAQGEGGGSPDKPEKWLLTNGGGKDTLAGMLILNRLGREYDVFEGQLPFGADDATQYELLSRLRSAAAPFAHAIRIDVDDDFFDRPESEFRAAGVDVDYFKTDFFLGHTANYVGYFPILLFHGYTRMWFNIERSADEVNAVWKGEPIRHQWCKSVEYQALMTDLYRKLTGDVSFDGFVSTLRGLYDTSIYAIVSAHPELLRQTHSCNYGKPWCGRCPKCCFCYLMMTAFLDEQFAMTVLDIHDSLLDNAEITPVWDLLFATDSVAWECVASKDECALALSKVAATRSIPPHFEQYLPERAVVAALEAEFEAVELDLVPTDIRSSLIALLAS